MVPENIHTCTSPNRRLLEIREGGRGEEGLKSQSFEENYEAKLEFSEGWGKGFKPNNLPWEEYGYFLEQHNQ